jgi:hypothetical protein
MKTLTTVLLFLFALTLAPNASADDAPRELKDKLFARYDQKNLNVVRANILVAELAEGPGLNGRAGIAWSIPLIMTSSIRVFRRTFGRRNTKNGISWMRAQRKNLVQRQPIL